jgi:hypothetical protein
MYPNLLEDEAHVTLLQAAWESRYKKALTDQHLAALLLDPRSHVRAFVQDDAAILGSTASANHGNTTALHRAVRCILCYAGTDVPAGDPIVQNKLSAGTNLQDAQELVLETNLRAFVGVHPRVTTKKLGISDEVLRKCVSGDSPKEWWKTQAPTGLQLRLSALRLFGIKPTSTAVERVWNVVGDNLSSKRRCMHKGRLAKLVHARMNMHLVPCDQLTDMDLSEELDMESMFASVFDVVADIDEQEEVAGVAKAREMLQSEEDL